MSVAKRKKATTKTTNKIKKAAKYSKKQKIDEAGSYDEFCDESKDEEEPEKNANIKRKGVNVTSDKRPNNIEAQPINGKTRQKQAH